MDIDLESRHPSNEPMKLGTKLPTERAVFITFDLGILSHNDISHILSSKYFELSHAIEEGGCNSNNYSCLFINFFLLVIFDNFPYFEMIQI